MVEKFGKKHEDLQLYDLKVNKNKNYHEVSRVIGRSPISCERRFQSKDWTNYDTIGKDIVNEITKSISENKTAIVLEQIQKQKVTEVCSQEHKEKISQSYC